MKVQTLEYCHVLSPFFSMGLLVNLNRTCKSFQSLGKVQFFMENALFAEELYEHLRDLSSSKKVEKSV